MEHSKHPLNRKQEYVLETVYQSPTGMWVVDAFKKQTVKALMRRGLAKLVMDDEGVELTEQGVEYVETYLTV